MFYCFHIEEGTLHKFAMRYKEVTLFVDLLCDIDFTVLMAFEMNLDIRKLHAV